MTDAIEYALALLTERRETLTGSIETDGAHPDPEDMDELDRVDDALAALRALNAPAVRHYLDVGTEHLPRPELDGLAGNDLIPGHDWIITNHAYGWWVWVPPDLNDEDNYYPSALADYPGLAAIIRHAHAHGCSWVNLDADGCTISDLPVYDHA